MGKLLLIRLDEVDSLVSIFCQIIFCTKGLTLLKKFSKSTISTDKEKKSKNFSSRILFDGKHRYISRFHERKFSTLVILNVLFEKISLFTTLIIKL